MMCSDIQLRLPSNIVLRGVSGVLEKHHIELLDRILGGLLRDWTADALATMFELGSGAEGQLTSGIKTLAALSPLLSDVRGDSYDMAVAAVTHQLFARDTNGATPPDRVGLDAAVSFGPFEASHGPTVVINLNRANVSEARTKP